MMKKILFYLILMLAYSNLTAQDFEVPENYEPKETSDYKTHNDNILKCIDWLQNTPLGTEAEKRKEANAYLLKWLTGTADVHIELKQEIVTFMDSGELLMIFMSGWAKYELTSQKHDKVKGSIQGVDAVLNFYEANRSQINKNKNVEKYIKMKEKGKLISYIEKNA